MDFKSLHAKICSKCLCGSQELINSFLDFIDGRACDGSQADILGTSIIALIANQMLIMREACLEMCSSMYNLLDKITEYRYNGYLHRAVEHNCQFLQHSAKKAFVEIILTFPTEHNGLVLRICERANTVKVPPIKNRTNYLEIMSAIIYTKQTCIPKYLSQGPVKGCSSVKITKDSSRTVESIVIDQFRMWKFEIPVESTFLQLWNKLYRTERTKRSLDMPSVIETDIISRTLDSLPQNRDNFTPLFELINNIMQRRTEDLSNLEGTSETMLYDRMILPKIILDKIEQGLLLNMILPNRNHCFIGSSHSETCTGNKESDFPLQSSQLRKLVLCILMAMAEVCSFKKTSPRKLKRNYEQLLQLIVRCGFSGTEFLADWLIPVFIDQDDQLIEALIVNLELYKGLKHTDPNIEENLKCRVFCPHRCTILFLSNTGMDHNIILDFLTSNETALLLYLVRYLKLASLEWNVFIAAHDNLGVRELGVSLDDTMAVMIRTRLSIERLDRNRLFPYHVKPLLRLFKLLEKKYESK